MELMRSPEADRPVSLAAVFTGPPCAGPRRRRCLAGGLWIVLVLVLGACARAPVPPVPQAPSFKIPRATLNAIDDRIGVASVHARNGAMAYARVAMEEWQGLVRRYTEEVFIPWYSSYWTQQWITTKVAWYQLQYAEGEATPEERLAAYLQEAFSEQVLQPVNGHVDPVAVMQASANDYLRELESGLSGLPSEFQIPPAAFDRHLAIIPAIVVHAGEPREASLLDVLNAQDLRDLPAYEALLRRIAAANGIDPDAPAGDRLTLVARRAVDKLVGTAAVRGGTAAAAAIVGGLWGAAVSAGAAVWGVAEHDRDMPAMQAQLRDNLEAALDIMWQGLVEDPHAGVTAPVQHMATQIDQAVYHPVRTPLPPEGREPTVLF